jgi:hypothetical protein
MLIARSSTGVAARCFKISPDIQGTIQVLLRLSTDISNLFPTFVELTRHSRHYPGASKAFYRHFKPIPDIYGTIPTLEALSRHF